MKFTLNLDMSLDNDDYSFTDILALFQIPKDYTEDHLKQSKKIVQGVHPDKSNLDPAYFIFFFNAYKLIYSNYYNRFNNNTKTILPTQLVYNTAQLDEDAKSTAAVHHQQTIKFNQSGNATRNEDFINAFNEVYEEPAAQQVGYGEWLKNEEIIKVDDISTASLQIKPLEERVMSTEIFCGGYDLIQTGDGTFNSALFSSFGYSDLKQAYEKTIIPDWDKETTDAFINCHRQPTTYSTFAN